MTVNARNVDSRSVLGRELAQTVRIADLGVELPAFAVEFDRQVNRLIASELAPGEQPHPGGGDVDDERPFGPTDVSKRCHHVRGLHPRRFGRGYLSRRAGLTKVIDVCPATNQRDGKLDGSVDAKSRKDEFVSRQTFAPLAWLQRDVVADPINNPPGVHLSVGGALESTAGIQKVNVLHGPESGLFRSKISAEVLSMIQMSRFFAVLLLVLVSFGWVGCTGSSNGTTVLRVANWGGAGDDSEFRTTTRELLREFEEANPGVKVQVEGIPGSQEYVSKLLLSFIAGAEPDIITLDASSAAVFIDNKVLADLTPLIAADPTFQLDDYYPNVVDIARREQALYAIPSDFTPMVMYYNKRLFDEAGVPYPQPGWTYADFLNKAKRLTGGDRYGFKFSNWMPGWIMWLWNNGGDVLTPDGKRAQGAFDSAECIEAVTFLSDLIEKHRVAPNLSAAAAMGVDLFTTGRAAMEVSGHWALVGYSVAPKGPDGQPLLRLEDVGVVELPSQTGKSVTVMYEAGYAIGRNCDKKELAWKFIKHMTSRDAQTRLNKTGIAVSARKDVSQARATDPRERVFLDIVPSARAPWGSRVEGYDFVETTGQKMMDAVLQSGVSPAEALRTAARRIDEDFARR